MRTGEKTNHSHVLLKVKACGIKQNRQGTKHGQWYSEELTGIIEQIDDKEHTLKPGDHVGTYNPFQTSFKGNQNPFGTIPSTSSKYSLSPYIKVPISSIAKLPDALSFSHAAPLFGAGLTAYKALLEANILPGERVAILGIKGIGHLAIQLAYKAGAEVIALTGSRNKIDHSHEFGASDCFAGKPEDLALCLKATGGADVLIATIPAPYDLDPFIQALGEKSRVVFAGPGTEQAAIDQAAANAKNIRFLTPPAGNKIELETILSLAADGEIMPAIKEYQFEKADQALHDLQSGKIPFRAVLTS